MPEAAREQNPALARRALVWVVDDSPLEARITAGALSGTYETETFHDGASLLETLSLGGHPDLLVLDWHLPDLSGPEICASLRSRWDEVTLPVLMVTAAEPTPAHILEALSAGANDYLSKPCDPAVLLARAGTLVRTRALHQRALLAEQQRREEGERVLRTLESMGDAYLRLDPDFRIIQVNANQERLSGLQRSQTVGRIYWDVFLPSSSDPSPLTLAYRQAMKDRVALHLEHGGAPANLWREVDILPEPDGGLSVFFRDITERKRVELALKLSEERSRALVASMTEGLIFQGPDGALEHANRSAEVILGQTLVEMKGRTSRELSWHAVREDGTDLPVEEHPPTRVFASGVPVTEAIMGLNRPDGTLVWLMVNSQPTFAPETGALNGVVSSFTDVSERLLADREARARAGYERQLIGVVSHDLRTPLQTIALSTELLRRAPELDKNLARGLERIDKSTQRAIRMVRDLLDFTQARLGGGMKLVRQSGDLHDIVERAVEELRLVHPRSPIVFERAGDGIGAWDPDRVAQLVGNLLSNAAVYGARGEPIRVSTRATGELVSLEVQNHGTPVPPEVMRKMFEPMKRGESNGRGAAGSIGLGLYIVKQIADAHAGQARVRSTAEEGTTVSVSLPRYLAEERLPGLR